jgi:glycosyltransferase involved in cell wall biosynthesis
MENFLPLSETFIYNQIKELKNHFVIQIVCEKRMSESRFPIENVHVLSRPKKNIYSFFYKRFIGRKLFFLKKEKRIETQIQNLQNQFNPDLIFFHFGINAIQYIPLLNQNASIPIFIYFHGYDASQLPKTSITYRKGINKILQQKNVRSLFDSDGLLQIFRNYVPHESGKGHYIGIDPSVFSKSQKTKNLKTTIFAQLSRFVEKKGHRYTIEAFKHYLKFNPSAELRLAGDGPLLSSIKQLVNDLAIEKNIVFYGSLEPSQVPGFLDECDVYIQHSITAKNGDSEGLPLTIMEAMSLNKAIISTYHSGIPELVENGVNGFLVKEKDIIGLVEAMKNINQLKPPLSNRKKILTSFNLKTQTEKLAKMINDFIDQLS